MNNLKWLPLVAALLVALNDGNTAQAGWFGAGGYSCCPTTACSSCGDYCNAKTSGCAQYRTVREIVREQQQYTCCKTVYDCVTEKIPVQCTLTVRETYFRDCC